MPPSRSLFHLRFAFLVAWREGYLAETNKRLVVTAAHSCATLTYPPSFVLLVTAVKVVMQHSPSLLRWMSSATSASPDEARKEWRRGGMMFLFISFNFFLHELWAWSKVSHWPLFSFNFFFHVLSSTSNLLDWPKHVFSFLPRKGIEKGKDNIHSDVRVDILSLIVWTQIGSKCNVVALLNCPGKCAARLKLQFSAASLIIFSAHKSAGYAGWSHFSIIKNCLNFKMTAW